MADAVTEDETAFGINVFVYCRQHLRPHITGWCTVHADQKLALEARSMDEAYAECERRGLKIYR